MKQEWIKPWPPSKAELLYIQMEECFQHGKHEEYKKAKREFFKAIKEGEGAKDD